MRARGRDGLVLMMVLYVGLVVWGFLAALLLASWSHHRVALATRDRAALARLLDEPLALLRAAAPADWPDAGHVEEGSIGRCSWSLAIRARENELLRVSGAARSGGIELLRDATVHAPPR